MIVTSIQTLGEWHQRGIDQGDSYMMVVCDTFDYGDYPVFIKGSKEDAIEKKREYQGKEMTKIMEVYDLSKPFLHTEMREMAV